MNLYHGDCLEVLPTFPPASVEAIITDLPYGTTACEWDSIIPLAPMWEQVKRVLKPNGAFITTSAQPFTSVLISSNLEMFKVEWIWNKRSPTGFMNVKRKPMVVHENIVVFSNGNLQYNPQLRKDVSKPFGKIAPVVTEVYGNAGNDRKFGVGYPLTILNDYPRPNNLSGGGFHPTQKPVELYEYLIRTYTNAGETVLDICMGSGTTGVATIQTGRNFIGIEKEQKYFETASRRIAQAPQPLFTEPPRQPTQRVPDRGNVTPQFDNFE
jgi:DNA modification methylase